MAVRSMGGGLAAAGLQEQQQAADILGEAAKQEQDRNIGNRNMERAAKAGNVQLGAMGGAALGFQFGGPVGGMVGGLLGAIGGGELF